MVDTPDWFCSGLSQKDMRQDVGLCVRLSAPGPHAFLLVIPVQSSEGEERRMLEKMEIIFGESCWRHTLILFTHAEGLRERSVEELLQTGSQELQQLVEKCGTRCHLLSVKDRHDDTQITQLLEKVEEMVSGNGMERYYSSQTYWRVQKLHSALGQMVDIEEKTVREERQRRQEFDMHLQQFLTRMDEEILQLERNLKAEMQAEFNKQMEDKDMEIEKMRLMLQEAVLKLNQD
ncbi:GTPase IMAP family member 9-like [Sardina pilchardus]|uniref:GTPase IMAP family member 9-like n=1 Tax=Sardina pilchardus TaxID=27697 RepID=UPI002E0FEAE6